MCPLLSLLLFFEGDDDGDGALIFPVAGDLVGVTVGDLDGVPDSVFFTGIISFGVLADMAPDSVATAFPSESGGGAIIGLRKLDALWAVKK